MKNRLGKSSASSPPAPAAFAQSVPSVDAERIAARAYELYQADGGKDGRHEDHWLQAERELRGKSDAESSRPSASTAR
jgi:Protein of unknown function (DUF2934)